MLRVRREKSWGNKDAESCFEFEEANELRELGCREVAKSRKRQKRRGNKDAEKLLRVRREKND